MARFLRISYQIMKKRDSKAQQQENGPFPEISLVGIIIITIKTKNTFHILNKFYFISAGALTPKISKPEWITILKAFTSPSLADIRSRLLGTINLKSLLLFPAVQYKWKREQDIKRHWFCQERKVNGNK